MAASASSMPTCSADSSQPPAPAICARDACACWPRIKRQRVIWVLSIEGITPSQVLKVEVGQLLQLLFFCLGQFLAQHFTDIVRVCSPNLPEVFCNAALFGGAEVAKRAAKKNQGAFKLIVCERRDVLVELLPESEARQQRVTIALCETFEPTRAQISRDPGRQTA